MGECTIESLQEDKVHKLQCQLKAKAHEAGQSQVWAIQVWAGHELGDTFGVAKACEATCEGLLIPSLCWKWKWMKPTNSLLVPLGSITGFVSFKKRLTGTQPMIILIMKPPQALASQKLVDLFFFGKHILF